MKDMNSWYLEEEVEPHGGEGHEDVQVEEKGRPRRRLVLWLVYTCVCVCLDERVYINYINIII